MSIPKPRSPFKWEYALAAVSMGAGIGALALWIGDLGRAPLVGYAWAGGFGAFFAFVLYLNRNVGRAEEQEVIFNPAQGTWGDCASGNASSTLGGVGHAVKTSDELLEASRRCDP